MLICPIFLLHYAVIYILLGLARPGKGPWDARKLSSIAEQVVEIEDCGIVEPGLPAVQKSVRDTRGQIERLEGTTMWNVAILMLASISKKDSR